MSNAVNSSTAAVGSNVAAKAWLWESTEEWAATGWPNTQQARDEYYRAMVQGRSQRSMFYETHRRSPKRLQSNLEAHAGWAYDSMLLGRKDNTPWKAAGYAVGLGIAGLDELPTKWHQSQYRKYAPGHEHWDERRRQQAAQNRPKRRRRK